MLDKNDLKGLFKEQDLVFIKELIDTPPMIKNPG